MAKSKRQLKPPKNKQAQNYRHPESENLMRPDVGTQAQFKKKLPPKKFRYDDSLSPSLEWDGQNPAREQGEALIREVLEAQTIEAAKAAASKLKAMSKPFLNWAGKAERLSFEVPTLPLFIHERLSTKAILETLKGHRRDKQIDMFDLFGDPQHPIHEQVLRAYEHKDKWVNRMILGDSLIVMNSLLQYEGLGGQVQTIYIDPPYGVKFGSNFQPFIRRRDVEHGHTPIAMLGGYWEEELQKKSGGEDQRPPVFILVCKNTRIAKVIYDWLAEDKRPVGIPPAKIDGFRNRDGIINTIRVDSKVVHETDTGEAKGDEARWMRLTLDTVGKTSWPTDKQGRPIYPDGFEDLAKKLERPLHPPGRDVRCIVSVGMLTEGWDCNTVTHIVGLRPFMSQLLCEQVVGRGLRRTVYELDENGRFTEEVATVFGVPFEVIPFKASTTGGGTPRQKRFHVQALPSKADYEITFPRVEGYTQAIRNRVTVNWESVPRLVLEPGRIPPEVETKGLSVNTTGRLSLSGPGKINEVTLAEYRAKRRVQEVVFDIAGGLTKHYVAQPSCQVPAHVLFPQVANIVRRYMEEKVKVHAPADIKDVGLSPYYGWLVEILTEHIHPDTSAGETPEVPLYEKTRGAGSTAEVDFWTSKEPREVVHCHLNYIVPDTKKWEQQAAYYLDKHPMVDAFVKNTGLGFAIPYLYNGQPHDYMPDFIVRLKTEPPIHLILETKGYDPLAEVKKAAAERWVSAVNADGSYGKWAYVMVRQTTEVNDAVTKAARAIGAPE